MESSPGSALKRERDNDAGGEVPPSAEPQLQRIKLNIKLPSLNKIKIKLPSLPSMSSPMSFVSPSPGNPSVVGTCLSGWSLFFARLKKFCFPTLRVGNCGPRESDACDGFSDDGS